jgi:hypothetical protein
MSPGDEYARRLGAWESRVSRLEVLQSRLGSIRLLLAAAAAAVAWESLHGHWLSPLWLSAPVAAFIGAVIYHGTLRRGLSQAERAAAFYRSGLARIQDRWAGGGRQGERFFDAQHVYAADLDLFGKGGLFELLCAARTRMGEEALARWLLAPACLEEIAERHACVGDLTSRLDLREDLAVLGEGAGVGVHPQSLLTWAESPNVLGEPWIRWTARLLPVLCVASAIVWAVAGNPAPFVAVILIEIAVLYSLGRRLAQVLDPAETAFEDLKIFAKLLVRVEREPFAVPAMQALVRTLASQDRRAARSIEQLGTIAELAGSRQNLVVRWFLAVPLLYSVQVALAAERWRRAHGEKARAWVEVAGRFEALSSIAQYSFEHPADPFPEFVERPACFRASGLGHPLIPLERCVRNDVDVSDGTRALLVSGSNMSGKSTLLRAVGINTVLAMAGAPVRARSLELTPLTVGASIRINDSLSEGTSRFYAEIARLRQLQDLASGEPPLLFLLDEALQGTNSKDRRIGAEAIIRAFLGRGAIGLISTHDLALTEIQGIEQGSVRNVHFEDEIEEGRMKFDFKLRDGVVAQSNGLELIRSIGLKV